MKKEYCNDPVPPDKAGFVFVPVGNAARTRLAKAVEGAIEVVTFTRWGAKRMGYYVPEEAAAALEKALAESAERRAKQRERSKKRRAERESKYRKEFRSVLLKLFPKIPSRDADSIVRRATEVGSRRVGRSRQLDIEDRVWLATIAHIRHNHTKYDELLSYGLSSAEAREEVSAKIDQVLAAWCAPEGDNG